MVILNDNILNIKGKKTDLELGDYTRPKFFYLYDKIYVTLTDRQNQKVHLLDSQSQAIPGFPIIGTGSAQIEDMNGDKFLEVVVPDKKDGFLIYELR